MLQCKQYLFPQFMNIWIEANIWAAETKTFHIKKCEEWEVWGIFLGKVTLSPHVSQMKSDHQEMQEEAAFEYIIRKSEEN